MTYPHCEHDPVLYMDNLPYQYGDRNKEEIEELAWAIKNMMISRNQIRLLNPYNPLQTKSGKKIYKDLGDCWIVIAYESGPLKLLEIEWK